MRYARSLPQRRHLPNDTSLVSPDDDALDVLLEGFRGERRQTAKLSLADWQALTDTLIAQLTHNDDGLKQLAQHLANQWVITQHDALDSEALEALGQQLDPLMVKAENRLASEWQQLPTSRP
jgi:hypothetical protein